MSDLGIEKIRKCIGNVTLSSNEMDTAFIVSVIKHILQGTGKEKQLLPLLHNIVVTNKYEPSSFSLHINETEQINVNILETYGASSSHGIVYLIDMDEQPAILKIPKSGENQIQFIGEMIINILLTCFQKYINPYRHIHYPVVPLLFLCTLTDSEASTFATFYAKMDETIDDLLIQNIGDENMLGLFYQIAFFIDMLQDNAGLVHRDLHGNNIMVRKNKRHLKKFGKFRFECIYDVYFIDFGRSCIDLQKCIECDMPFSKYNNVGEDEIEDFTCKNNSHDLRFFLGFMFHRLKSIQEYNDFYPQTYTFLSRIFSERGKLRQWQVYGFMEDDIWPEFYPENVMLMLREEIINYRGY